MIEDVDGRRFEADRQTLFYAEQFENAGIPNVQRRSDNHAGSRGSELARSRWAEGSRIEPLIDATLAGGKSWIGQKVRPDGDVGLRRTGCGSSVGGVGARPTRM